MSILKMRDLTSKAEVLETYAELFDMFDDNKEICKELCKVYDKIRGLPTIDPVKHGKWILQDTSYWLATHAGDVQVNRVNLKCPFCGWRNYERKEYNYCPNCGERVERSE